MAAPARPPAPAPSPSRVPELFLFVLNIGNADVKRSSGFEGTFRRSDNWPRPMRAGRLRAARRPPRLRGAAGLDPHRRGRTVRSLADGGVEPAEGCPGAAPDRDGASDVASTSIRIRMDTKLSQQ
ncbi:hypothetical protein EVAR_77777_1 [Eumeta japonica]|uniref:Uncharacterized protein n=1 Tax=Eumeta variegata TaxID=151549 RepID=A0A4C1TAX0_EUMVA|nr:hypothetical protein EVAR_77777_1 [Eumeta japonica]